MNTLTKWSRIKGSNYCVSNTGLIKHIESDSPRSLRENRDGYKRTNITINGSRKTIRVHRVVADHFIPNPDGKKEVNHKDGDKSNNCVDNLEWCTRKENVSHAIKTGLFNSFSAFSRKDVIRIRMRYNNGDSQKELGLEYGVCGSTISKMVRGKTYKNIPLSYENQMSLF